MTRTIEIELLKYDELSDDAKQKAREWYTSDLSYEWWDSIFEDFERICEILGVELATDRVELMNGSSRRKSRIWFNGFYHQGAGSSFEGDYVYKKGAHKAIREYAPTCEALHDVADSLLAIQKANFYRVTASISNNGRYHSLSVDSQLTDYVNGGSDYANVDIDDDVKSAFDDLNHYLFSSLESEYEYLTSDEVAEESIRVNGYEFTIDGEIA